MKISFEWDVINIDELVGGNEITSRIKVFGGWLIRSRAAFPENGICESMVFIPDPNHEWEI